MSLYLFRIQLAGKSIRIGYNLPGLALHPGACGYAESNRENGRNEC